MALEQKLHLKLSQKLIMTPSLQQAIKLLQLSKLELQEVLNQELLENPLLEETAEEVKTEEADAEAQEKTQTEEEAKAAEPQKEKDKDSFDEIDYDAYFQDYIEYGYNPRMSEEHEEFPIENTLTRPPNLTDHLTWQLMMSDASPRIKEIGQFIIGNIDEDGYLRASNEEIMAAAQYAPDEVDQALKVIQSLDPIGVGARDLRECLLLQLEFLEVDEPLVETIIRDHWDMFMQRHFVQLAKSLGIDMKTLEGIVEIIKHQREFLEKGIDYLRPLVLRDVADDIQMHESTVSRVVSNKYMHTPRGLFLMKYFFHSGIDSDTGEDISSLTVKKKIQSYIEAEDPRKPLSDSKIMKILNDEGINIARRTVAKYRDELNIPSSTDRKQVF